MKKIFGLLFTLISLTSLAQTVPYKIKADSIELSSNGVNGTNLIIKNNTKNKTGAYLKNIGNGVTKFNYAIDSAYVSGGKLYLLRGNYDTTQVQLVSAETDPVWLSDSASYYKKTAITALLALKLNISDTASMLAAYNSAINLRVKYSDTASMLSNYFTGINIRVKYADTAAMLLAYQTAINEKQPQLSGTGFVKITGTTISYDNNTYQPLLTNPVTGTGTLNFVPKWTPNGTNLGDSKIFDDGTFVGIGTVTPSQKLDILGNLKLSGEISNVDTTTGITDRLWSNYRPINYGTSYGARGVQMGFNSGYGLFNVNASGRPNVVANYFMYNVSNGGGRINTNEASFRFAAENHFEMLGGKNYFEFFFPEVTTKTGTGYRPFAIYAGKDTTADSFLQSLIPAIEFFSGNANTGSYFSANGTNSTGQWSGAFTSPNSSSGIRFLGSGASAETNVTSVPANQNLLYNSWNNIYFDGTNTVNNFSWTKSGNILSKVNVSGTMTKQRTGSTDSIMFDYGSGAYKAGIIANYGTGEIQYFAQSGGYFQTFWHSNAQAFRTISGGIAGSSSASGNFTISSTSNATKGKILFGTSAYDEVNNRLGIGTASPSANLQVEGSSGGEIGTYIRNTNTGGYTVLRLGSAAHPTSIGGLYALGSTYGTSGAYVANGVAMETLGSGGLSLTAGNASADIRFYAGGLTAGSERMRVLSGGNVGIGTTSPTTRLQVNSTTTLKVFSLGSAATGSYNEKFYIDTSGQQQSFNTAAQMRTRLGVTTAGQSISTRDGEFSVGLVDAGQGAAIRMLTSGTGFTYIDGYTEGALKANNYDLVIGSRGNNTGANLTSNTTRETGTNVQIGFQTATVPSSVLSLNTVTRGMLMPRMTTAQRDAIASPAAWLTIICTDCTATDGSTGVMQVYNLGTTTWKNAW